MKVYLKGTIIEGKGVAAFRGSSDESRQLLRNVGPPMTLTDFIPHSLRAKIIVTGPKLSGTVSSAVGDSTGDESAVWGNPINGLSQGSARAGSVFRQPGSYNVAGILIRGKYVDGDEPAQRRRITQPRRLHLTSSYKPVNNHVVVRPAAAYVRVGRGGRGGGAGGQGGTGGGGGGGLDSTISPGLADTYQVEL